MVTHLLHDRNCSGTNSRIWWSLRHREKPFLRPKLHYITCSWINFDKHTCIALHKLFLTYFVMIQDEWLGLRGCRVDLAWIFPLWKSIDLIYHLWFVALEVPSTKCQTCESWFIDMEIRASNCSDVNQGRAPRKTSGENCFQNWHRFRHGFWRGFCAGLLRQGKKGLKNPRKSTPKSGKRSAPSKWKIRARIPATKFKSTQTLPTLAPSVLAHSGVVFWSSLSQRLPENALNRARAGRTKILG